MVLAALLSVILGLSILVYDSPLAPLIVLGVVVAATFGLASLRMPILVLDAVLVVNLLPNGLIPASINSILNRSLALVALGVWVLDMTRRRSRFVWPSAIWLMSGFLVWSLLTLLWTSNLDIGRDTLVKYVLRLVVFLFLISNEINTWKTLRFLIYTLALMGWIFVVAGIGTVLSEGYVTGTRLQVLGGNDKHRR